MHNLYGHMHAMTTYDTLWALTRQRPFVLTRSTFVGTGMLLLLLLLFRICRGVFQSD